MELRGRGFKPLSIGSYQIKDRDSASTLAHVQSKDRIGQLGLKTSLQPSALEPSAFLGDSNHQLINFFRLVF